MNKIKNEDKSWKSINNLKILHFFFPGCISCRLVGPIDTLCVCDVLNVLAICNLEY